MCWNQILFGFLFVLEKTEEKTESGKFEQFLVHFKDMYPLLLLLILSVFFTTEGQPGPNTETALASKDQIKSVEFNLAELSPRGPKGGYAMPASGSSHPDITFQRLIAGGSWISSNATINAGQQVKLKWSSTNANRGCEATAGTGFQTGHNAGGIDHSITEPTAGNSETYTVRCESRIYCVGKDCYPTWTDYHETESISITTRNPAPTATLEQRIGNSGTWSGSNVTINVGQQVHLKWSSTNADSCTGSGTGFSTYSTGGSLSGTDYSITEPTAGTSTTYTVTCTQGTATTSDSITVTNASTPTLTATLEQRIGNSGTWSTSNVTINVGQQVHLKWSSTNASSCTGSGGVGGFSTGASSTTSGTDDTITEPTAGTSTTYTVTCTGVDSNITDSITVTTNTNGIGVIQTATLEQRIGNSGTWSGSGTTINAGDEIQLQWSSTNASSCTGSGGVGGFSTGASSTTSGIDTSITEPSAGNSTTYTVTCTQGTATVSDSIEVTTNTGNSGVTATLEQSIGSGVTWSAWSSSNVAINAGQHVLLRWRGANATSCTGTGFDVSGTTGIDNDVTEPENGDETIYTITCTDGSNSVADSLVVSTIVVPPTLTASPPIVQLGNSANIIWNTNGSLACLLTGPDLPPLFNTPLAQTTGVYESIDIQTTQTFTIDCPAGSDRVTVHLVPQQIEE